MSERERVSVWARDGDTVSKVSGWIVVEHTVVAELDFWVGCRVWDMGKTRGVVCDDWVAICCSLYSKWIQSECRYKGSHRDWENVVIKGGVLLRLRQIDWGNSAARVRVVHTHKHNALFLSIESKLAALHAMINRWPKLKLSVECLVESLLYNSSQREVNSRKRLIYLFHACVLDYRLPRVVCCYFEKCSAPLLKPVRYFLSLCLVLVD